MRHKARRVKDTKVLDKSGSVARPPNCRSEHPQAQAAGALQKEPRAFDLALHIRCIA